MPYNPSRYAVATASPLAIVDEHFEGIDEQLIEIFDSDGTSEPFSSVSATSSNFILFRGHNTVPDSLYFKRQDLSGYDPVAAVAILNPSTVTQANLDSAAHNINTTGKALGTIAFVSDVGATGSFAISTGTAATDPWLWLASVTASVPA